MKQKPFFDWITESLLDTALIGHSVHLDGIVTDCDIGKPVGLELLRRGCAVLASVKEWVGQQNDLKKPITLMLEFPFEDTDELAFWHSENWDELQVLRKPPSLFLIKGLLRAPSNIELYRRPLTLPIDCGSEYSAYFSSSRSKEYMENGWEFMNGIDVTVNVD